MPTSLDTMTNLGVVSFLNARPLIEGLDGESGIRLHRAVPSALPAMLRQGQVDAALVPVIELAQGGGQGGEDEAGRGNGAWERISDACIACDGKSLTVRVFSRVPPEDINVLHTDGDSRTSVALARVIWHRWYKRTPAFVPLQSAGRLGDCESVLLIGDKVVTESLTAFEYEIDLGGVWKQWTHLPFVFAVWAAPAGGAIDGLAGQLSRARDRGVARAAAIAAEIGPAHGWPVKLAEEYLTRRLLYTLTPAARKGMQRFLELAAEEGIIDRPQELLR